MPEITVKHNVKDAKPPERDPIPAGVYHALIVKVTPGLTRFKPERLQMTVEYQVQRTADGSVADGDDAMKYAGRSVYQDYVLEPGDRAQANAREAFRIQQLLIATQVQHKTHEGGSVTFNTDHLVGKGVKMVITHRYGKLKPSDPPGTPSPVFETVDRVDSEVEAKDEDLV